MWIFPIGKRSILWVFSEYTNFRDFLEVLHFRMLNSVLASNLRFCCWPLLHQPPAAPSLLSLALPGGGGRHIHLQGRQVVMAMTWDSPAIFTIPSHHCGLMAGITKPSSSLIGLWWFMALGCPHYSFFISKWRIVQDRNAPKKEIQLWYNICYFRIWYVSKFPMSKLSIYISLQISV